MWAGDLNVSHKELDVTHPTFFRKQGAGIVGGPLWPLRFFIDDVHVLNRLLLGPEGQPGYTAMEQQLFTSALSQLGFVSTPDPLA
jgi:hypothetical protein